MLAGSSEENLRQLFRAFDINRDGRISKEEMRTLISDLQLQEYNDDQDGLVKSVFSEMDEDRDGLITPEEFVEACLAQKKISTMLTLRIIDIIVN